MDSLELDSDAFYICTEVSPRNYVVQKAIQIDKSQIERMVGNLEKNAAAAAAAAAASSNNEEGGSSSIPQPPPPPPLPYWFTRECKEKLMEVELPQPGSYPASSASLSFVHPNMNNQPAFDVKNRLKAQLEYYFSRENLMTDRYLRCQMDSEQYVPITVIAGFRKITQLTDDFDLIVETLRESNLVEVDEKGEKVRPITKRTTIILRNIGPDHREEVEKMLEGGPKYLDLKYGMNESWYVTYETEKKTQDAYVHLQGIEVMFNNKPICARIKAGGPPAYFDQGLQTSAPITRETPTPEHSSASFPPMMDLGTVLASYGFIPVATYTPGNAVVHVEEEAMTPIADGNQQFRYNENYLPQNYDPQIQGEGGSNQPTYVTPVVSNGRQFDEESSSSSSTARGNGPRYNQQQKNDYRQNENGRHHSDYRKNNHENNKHYNQSRQTNDYGRQNSEYSRYNERHSEYNGRHVDQRRNTDYSGRKYEKPQNGERYGNGYHRQNEYGRQNTDSAENRKDVNRTNEHGRQTEYTKRNDNSKDSKPYTENRSWYREPVERNYRRHTTSSTSSTPLNSNSRHASSSSNQSSATNETITPRQSTDSAASSESTSVTEPSTPVWNPNRSEMPAPPVWPAPKHARARKGSEAKTLDSNESNDGNITPTPADSTTTKKEKESDVGVNDLPSERKQSLQSVARSAFSFEEQAFPCLPKPAKEPEKKVEKPTFSSVAAGRRHVKQVPESKKSYAEKLKEFAALRS